MSDSETPKQKMARIRPTKRTLGSTRIKDLKCFNEVYQRMIEGWSLAELAKFIQEVKKESTDIARKTLITLLQNYRQQLPPGTITQKRLQPVFMKAKEAVEEGIDELVELEKLYKLQMSRIQIDVELEQKMKKLMGTTGQEVRIAKEILTAYADKKMDLGLTKRHIGQVQVDARLMADVAMKYEQTEVKQVIGDAQSRKKLLGLAERLLAMSNAPGLDKVRADPEIIDMVAEPVSDLDEIVEAEAEAPLDTAPNDNDLDSDLPSGG